MYIKLTLIKTSQHVKSVSIIPLDEKTFTNSSALHTKITEEEEEEQEEEEEEEEEVEEKLPEC